MRKRDWDDELRKDLMRWLMEFGDGWVTAAERGANSWYEEENRLSVVYYGNRAAGKWGIVVFDVANEGDISHGSARLNQRARDFLKGEL